MSDVIMDSIRELLVRIRQDKLRGVKMHNSTKQLPPMMTAEEVAKFLRVGPKTIYDLAKKGKLPHCRIGTLYRFERQEIIDLLRGKTSDQVDGDPDELDDVTSEFPQGSVPSTKRTIDTAEKAAIWNDAIQTAIDELYTIESNLRALFLEEDSFRSELIEQLDAGAEIPEDLEEKP